MKKISIIISLLLTIIIYGQNTRLMYEYRFASDINKKDSLTKELMYLDITKDGSKFYSRQYYMQDSTIQAELQKQLANGFNSFKFSSSKIEGKISYTVSKKYPDYTTTLHTSIGTTKYDIKSESKMNWKIENEKKTIEKFEAQKASISYGGREWIAWFTMDIPFQDGPYKFHGLPGAILEMTDSTGTHSFTFVGSKNIENSQKSQEDKTSKIASISFFNNKAIEISEDGFRKQWKDYKKDPVKEMRQMLSQSNNKIILNINGKTVDNPNEVIRTMEKNEKDKIAADNNKIEPSLYP